jgi:hypothetical protein
LLADVRERIATFLMEQVTTAGGKFHADETAWDNIVFGDTKLRPPYNNLSGRCGIVQQVVKCTIYYNNLSGGCGLVQQVVKCSI